MYVKKSVLSFSALFSLSILGLLGACSENPPPAPGPVEVSVQRVVAEPFTITTILSGRTSAYALAEVRPQVNGIILKRNFVEGAEVKAGQQLYQIDPASYRASYNSAKANLANAEATAVSTKLRAERYKGLVKTQAVSKQEYDDAVALMKQASATVLSAKAELEKANINLVYSEVKAPISGRIGRSSVTQGALVTAGQATPLAVIQQLDPIYVDLNQSSAEYLRLRQELASGRLQPTKGGDARIKLIMEDGTPYPYEGRLQLSDINVDPTTSAITIRAIFPNPQRLLLPGVFVRATLEEGINNQAYLIPQQAVMRDQKGEPFVFIVGKDNKVAIRYLNVGSAVGNNWVVFKGVEVGELFMMEGMQKVKPGDTVKVVLKNNLEKDATPVASNVVVRTEKSTSVSQGQAAPSAKTAPLIKEKSSSVKVVKSTSAAVPSSKAKSHQEKVASPVSAKKSGTS